MKICFINPPFKSEYGKFSRENRSPTVTRSGTLYYPLWLIYAAAVCEKDGFTVSFLDAPAFPMNNEQALKWIEDNASESSLFVLDTSTPSIDSDINFGDILKEKYTNAYVILVGTHPSALPQETLEKSNKIDAVARREYDYIIRDFARKIRNEEDPFSTKGITYRKDGVIISNNDMEYIENLDDIPFASEFIKNHLNYKDYFFAAAAFPEVQLFTGRGCMAHCNYCVYPQTMHGHKYRLRSAENVVRELEFILDNFPDVKEIVFEDDTFTAIKEHTIEICTLMIQRGLNKKIKWLCNARVNLDFETMKIMKKAGCHLIIPGIESGSQEILNNIKKGTNLDLIHDYVENAKKAGLMIHACYMVGNKGETHETMEETLRLALELNTDTAQFYPLLPFPGTEAYAWAKSNGYIKGDYCDYVKEDGTINCVFELPNISSSEMVNFCNNARKRYYLRVSYIMHRILAGLKNPDDFKRSVKAFLNIKKYLFSNVSNDTGND